MTVVNGARLSDKTRLKRQTRRHAPELPPSPEPTSWFRRKGFFDRAVAAVLLVPGLPIILLLVILIRLTSKGPGIFCQKRVGKNGKVFTMLKLRSMRVDAEHLCGAIWARDDDPRTTPVGWFLRRFHLDELPQLFNVLWGEMSLVGPRPPIAKEVAEYEWWQQRRLSVKPGLTCLWQVSGRSEIGFVDWVRMDLWYVKNQGFWTDLCLLAKTPVAVLARRGAY